MLDGAVADGFVPGAVALVARDRDVGVAVAGRQAFGGAPMRRDSIFRIASMTKPITAAAVMMLVADGRLRLDEPVDRLLPELANRRVLRTMASELDDTVPAERPITVEDLLSFRLGWGLQLTPPDRFPVTRRIAERRIMGFGPPDPSAPLSPDQWLAEMGRLPLFAQPGAMWMYTTGAVVAGILVGRASGKSLGEFMAERIFAPLGMVDTGFVVPEGKRDRFATAYAFSSGRPQVTDDPNTGKWTRPPALEAGDAGLVSTADDYLKFAQLLLAGGEAGGRRLLSADAVRAMMTNHLTATQRPGPPLLQANQGWGYGMSVIESAASGQPRPGSVGWPGGFGTTWFTDPAARLTGITLTQHALDGPIPGPLYGRLTDAAYAS